MPPYQHVFTYKITQSFRNIPSITWHQSIRESMPFPSLPLENGIWQLLLRKRGLCRSTLTQTVRGVDNHARESSRVLHTLS